MISEPMSVMTRAVSIRGDDVAGRSILTGCRWQYIDYR
jgi:hypothetical protein